MNAIKISYETSIDDACRLVQEGHMIDIAEASFRMNEVRAWFKKRHDIVYLLKSYRLQLNLGDNTVVWYKGHIPFRPLDGRCIGSGVKVRTT